MKSQQAVENVFLSRKDLLKRKKAREYQRKYAEKLKAEKLSKSAGINKRVR